MATWKDHCLIITSWSVLGCKWPINSELKPNERREGAAHNHLEKDFLKRRQ